MEAWPALKAWLIDTPMYVIWSLGQRIAYLFNPSSFDNKHNGTLRDDWTASNGFIKTIFRMSQIQAAREVRLEGPAIDVDLYDLQSESSVRLLDFTKTNRPLVVNFGSCT